MSIVPHTQFPEIPTGQIIRQTGSVFQSTREGLARFTCKYVGNYLDLVSGTNLTLYGTTTSSNRITSSPSPLFPSLLLWDSKVTEGKGGLGTWDAEYRGLDPALTSPPPPTYSLQVQCGNEPLMTHPKWISSIAGTPAAPLNGARFISYDKSGTNFNPPSTGGNPGTFDPATAVFHDWLNGSIIEGIEDYLTPNTAWIKTYVDFSQPDLSGVGSFSPPGQPAPQAPDNYNWFYLGATTSEQGGVIRIDESWKLYPTSAASQIIYGSS